VSRLFKACLMAIVIVGFSWLSYKGFQYVQVKIAQNQPLPHRTLQDLKPEWVESRTEAQIESLGNSTVFHDFGFTDQIETSGITFKHKIVPEGGKEFMAVHYDHGNGLTIADVDSDGLYDIYFISQVGKGELWRNVGNGRFEEITEKAGLEITGSKTSVSASFADIDNDGDPDLYVTVVRDGNFLFENDGSGIFTDISSRSGTDHRAHSSGTIFFDYDLDGLLDLFVTNIGVYTTNKIRDIELLGQLYGSYYGLSDSFKGPNFPERAETNVLYRNLGDNQFEDVTVVAGLTDTPWSGDASQLDANDDGFPDLYIINMQGPDEYYENDNGQRFIKKSSELFPETSMGAMGIKVFDFDNDGRQDIYISDMHSDMAKNGKLSIDQEKKKAPFAPIELAWAEDESLIFGNTFFKKTGTNEYREVSDEINAENYWPWGLSTGDLNADGYEDVFLTSSMNYKFRYHPNSLLLNDGGEAFLDSEMVLGVEPRREGRYAQPWFDLDCDGVDNEHQDCRGRSGEITVWGALGSRSSVIFDLDRDGDLDIVTGEWNDVPMVLISDLSEQKADLNYLEIELVGTESNRDGIGATVIVKSGEHQYTKVYDGKSGYLSQSMYPLYFGLGDAAQVDEIEVIWPSRVRQVIQDDIPLNTLIEIEEPAEN